MAALSNQRCSAGPRVFCADLRISPMSRLRRLELHSRLFLLPAIFDQIRPFSNREYHNLAESFASARTKVRFEFCAYCFLPDHWYAILLRDGYTFVSDILMRVKVGHTSESAKSNGITDRCGRADFTTTFCERARSSMPRWNTFIRILCKEA